VKQAMTDLTSAEVARILGAGLGVTPVQHVEPENWTPSTIKGKSYGTVAAQSAVDCGILTGANVWLDLEGVHLHTDPEIVIAYCNAWFDQVHQAGFLPGIYVGFQAILSPDQLYRRLKFTRYWSAYNLDTDQFPAIVGACMKQGVADTGDYPKNFTQIEIDVDTVTGDAQGRFPMVLAPDNWDVHN
jgi:hypothetical protein